MGYRLGIDVGGTFTDLVLFSEESGALVVEKVPSVPADPSEGIMDGIARILARASAAPADVAYVAHGTTVATNTLLQRHGARTALITTRGFRDLLEIARQRRPSLYDLHTPKPRTLVRRALRHEVRERVMADGTVRVPLDLAAADRVLDDLAREGIEALAVCFLYSFLHPDHERAVAERARRRLPGVAVSVSSEVLPELREYERLSTTVANAYLLPRMGSYVRAFRQRVADAGIRCAPYINQSNGGTISIDEAVRAPVRTVLSGPSAGVMGAVWLARHRGLSSLVTFDMGGTSTDVSFVRDGAPTLAFEREIDGIPLRVAGLDIETIGAGGGSIAWRDSGGALRVGPESAGANPGPACYARGRSTRARSRASWASAPLSCRRARDSCAPSACSSRISASTPSGPASPVSTSTRSSAWTSSSPRWRPRRWPGSSASGCRPRGALSSAGSTCATPGRTTSCWSRCRRRSGTRAGSSRWASASSPCTRRPTATRPIVSRSRSAMRDSW